MTIMTKSDHEWQKVTKIAESDQNDLKDPKWQKVTIMTKSDQMWLKWPKVTKMTKSDQKLPKMTKMPRNKLKQLIDIEMTGYDRKWL